MPTDNEQSAPTHHQRRWEERLRLAVAVARRSAATGAGMVIVLLLVFLLLSHNLPRSSALGNDSTTTGTNGTPVHRTALAPLVATDTPLPLPTDTPFPAPTATDTPVSPPAPSPTPVPPPITIGCFSAVSQAPGDPGTYRYDICVGAPAGASVTLNIWYCNSTYGPDAVGIPSMPASGSYSASWMRGAVPCNVPFTVTVNAKGTTTDGQQLNGSATFTVSA